MSEIEKLMQNAGVEKDLKSMPYGDIKEYYPEFTAEKQLSLIKWLVKKTYRNYFLIQFSFKTDLYQIECDMSDSKRHYKFSETLASMINVLWNDLTDTEKAEIKRILE